MNKYFLSASMLILLILADYGCKAITLADHGKTRYRIVIPAAATPNEKHAAHVLSKYLKQSTGADFIISDDNAKKSDYEICIGLTNRLPASANDKVTHQDGYSITTNNNNIVFRGGTGKGIVYAVYTFLEKFCGCRKYTSGPALVPRHNRLDIPEVIALNEIPAFDFREYYYTATVDSEYLEWHKLMQHFLDTNNTQWGMWVHTFQHLVPAEKYFDTNPEYFSFYGGKRQPAQLCLTNPDVYNTLVTNLRNEMKLKPGAKYWSVSQNDNYGYCRCANCHTVDSIEGSPSGSMLRFVNEVAAAFPDKVISTLAYQYTRSAPLITKPAKNVNIMFCSIECNRSMPISEDSTSAAFRKDLEGWGKLTGNILVWDYVVQFSNYISPFPNLHVLQPNLQYFRNNNVNDMFEQGSSAHWSDFGELKAYLLADLMWNPAIDADSVIADFTRGFYGAAGDDILAYYYSITANMQRSGKWLDIYGNPVSPHDSWLSEKNLDQYQSIFAAAYENAADDDNAINRLNRLRLPLSYARLEQAKYYGTGPLGIFEKDTAGKWTPNNSIRKTVDAFTAALKEQDMRYMNENGLSPEMYRNTWQHIFDFGMTDHFALGKNITYDIPYSPKYPAKGPRTLTDGIGGYEDYHYNWLGWEGQDMTVVIDLGKSEPVSIISCNFMEDQKSWIFLPAGVVFYTSVDGKKFTEFAHVNGTPPVADKNASIKMFSAAKKSFTEARFIKVVANSLKFCPPWHIGAGNKCWIFCDEIVVK